MHRVLLACLLLPLAFGAPRAAEIAVFYHTAWMPAASADSLAALLGAAGHSVGTLVDPAEPGALSNALSRADLALFPDQYDYGQLNDNLDDGAFDALRAFVAGGGGLIATGTYGFSLLNHVLFPDCDGTTVLCFASSGSNGDNTRQAAADGTPYASAPATLAGYQAGAVNWYFFFPPDALNLYWDQYQGTTVLRGAYGAGRYGWLAWGYAGVVAGGDPDGGWSDLLGIMVDDVAAIPEPPVGLLLAAVPALLLRRRVRAAWGGGQVLGMEIDALAGTPAHRDTADQFHTKPALPWTKQP